MGHLLWPRGEKAQSFLSRVRGRACVRSGHERDRAGWRRSALSRCELIKADVDKKKRMPGDQPIAWPNAEEASVPFASTSLLSIMPAPMKRTTAVMETMMAPAAAADASRLKRSH
jgi:hypothetical protein